MTIALLALGVLGLLISLVGTVFVKRVAVRLDLMDRPGGHKAHAKATPLGGGLAIIAGFWAPVWAGIAAYAALGPSGADWLPEAVAVHAGGVRERLPDIAAIFVGGLIIAGVGLIDDKRGLPALPRFAAQVGVALGLYLRGVRVTIFIDNPWITGLLTVGWIVCLTNSFNWLDNMDGLAGGVALIVGSILLALALQTGQVFLAATLAPLVGALVGFLVFNWSPASVFMGDCGGMHLGYTLAALSVTFTFYQPQRPLFPVVAPLLIFAAPLFDTVSVLAIRLRLKRPLYVGDNNHFSHRLVDLGMTRPQAVATVCLLTLALGLGATVLYHSTTAGTVVMLAQALALLAIIIVLERAAKKERQKPAATETAQEG